jgi:hypothetical protein
MSNFDLRKYLAEGKLLKESKYTEFVDDGENEYMDFNYDAIERDMVKYGKTEVDYDKFLNYRDFDVDPTDEEVENWFNSPEIDNNSLENKIQQWVNNNAGGYGPEETDSNYSKFSKEMNLLLSNTLEDFNPDYYGDDTSMSPDDILEDFINGAIT